MDGFALPTLRGLILRDPIVPRLKFQRVTPDQACPGLALLSGLKDVFPKYCLKGKFSPHVSVDYRVDSLSPPFEKGGDSEGGFTEPGF